MEALRLSRLGVECAAKTKDLMLELESREALIEVLKKFGTTEELKLEIANATRVAEQIKRPRVGAIMKRIQADATPGASMNISPLPAA
jgi:hypothetical protein